MLLKEYLFFLNEKLEDIKIDEKDRKWYDIINKRVKDKYKSEIEKIVVKNFKINHPIVDNKKTTITVKYALFRMLFDIQIFLFTKTGENIHSSLFTPTPLSFHIYKKNDRWNVYFSTLFIKEKFQNQGISKKIMAEMQKILRLIQNQREMEVQAVDVGIYAWSRVKGCKFENEDEHKIMQNEYEIWDREVNNNLKTKILKNPSDYPKEFLLSDNSPGIIAYRIPF